MTANILIWLPLSRHHEFQGHTSLKLSDDTYISWRSSFFQMEEDKGTIYCGSYVDDVNLEGRPPDHTCVLQTLDEDAIKKWWSSWQSKQKWKSQGEITPAFTVLEAVMMGLGWSRIDDGYVLSPKELIKQINELGIVHKNIKSKRKCTII